MKLFTLDFKKSLKRIMKNKVIVFNSLSSTSFFIGLIAGWTFMPKYMESQFRLSPSKSNFLTGIFSNLSTFTIISSLIKNVVKVPLAFYRTR